MSNYLIKVDNKSIYVVGENSVEIQISKNFPTSEHDVRVALELALELVNQTQKEQDHV